MESLLEAMAALARHPKWEVRLGLARVAANVRAEAFDNMLDVLAQEVNDRVRSAAESAVARRRDRRLASALGKQYAETVVTILNDVERQYGLAVRKAAQRAADHIGKRYARELYHEVVKLLTPLMVSVERIRADIGSASSAIVSRELDRIDGDTRRIGAVLKGMRDYASIPQLTFAPERITDVLAEAADVVRASSDGTVPIETDGPDDVVAEVARPRLLQALRNLLSNALESYEPGRERGPVRATARLHDGYVVIAIEDRGTGMSAEGVEQARLLFVTTKKHGTGFGLPLAISIVESEHNGRLSIDSQVGLGTSVKVVLPVKQ